MPDKTLTPDLCVIGGSSAGASLAAAAAAQGVPTLLVVPKNAGRRRPGRAGLAVHALAAAARRIGLVGGARDFGVAAEPAVDFARLREQALAAIADLARNESAARLAALGVGVIAAEARFVDPRSLAADGMEIRARRFVLAPESPPVVPAIRGLARAPYVTADSVLDLRECPRHLAVVGAGATGLALAQAFRRFGSEVTVLDAGAPLHDEDSECASVVLDAMAREGVTIRAGVEIERIEGRKGSIGISLVGSETLDATHLLVAAGRRPVLNGQGLELAGVQYDERGVRTGGDLRTTNPRVFAIAAAGGRSASLEAGRWQGRSILRNRLFRLPIRAAAQPVPRAVATDPALAHVGLREEEARTRHGRIRLVRAPFFENERAVIERESKGMVKLVTTRSGRLVGATIVGPGADELIAPYVLAIARRMSLRALTGPLFVAPTRAEIGQAAALDALARGLTASWPQRIINLVRSFE